MSALLRDDQPKSKSPASSNNSFENIRLVLNFSAKVSVHHILIDLLTDQHILRVSMIRMYYLGHYFIHFRYLQCYNSKDNSRIHQCLGINFQNMKTVSSYQIYMIFGFKLVIHRHLRKF